MAWIFKVFANLVHDRNEIGERATLFESVTKTLG